VKISTNESKCLLVLLRIGFQDALKKKEYTSRMKLRRAEEQNVEHGYPFPPKFPIPMTLY
jgi:hypothetical protein